MTDTIINEYFEWLYDLMCVDSYSEGVSFRKLMMRLHETEFRYSIYRDQNRAEDGIDLRYRFALTHEYKYLPEMVMDILGDDYCTVLEMMAALALRCEETIMDDPSIGNRTKQWFWNMIVSLGLGSMTNDKFDVKYVDYVLARFLDHEYEPNGRGGLFTIRHCDEDMRDIEIWDQLNIYINEIAPI